MKRVKAISPKKPKTSEESIYIGARHVKRAEDIAVWLTKERGKPVSREDATRYVIDKFCTDKDLFAPTP